MTESQCTQNWCENVLKILCGENSSGNANVRTLWTKFIIFINCIFIFIIVILIILSICKCIKYNRKVLNRTLLTKWLILEFIFKQNSLIFSGIENVIDFSFFPIHAVEKNKHSGIFFACFSMYRSIWITPGYNLNHH